MNAGSISTSARILFEGPRLAHPEPPAVFVLADRFPLRPGDVVFVGAAGVTRWNRVISQLLPVSGVLRNLASTQVDVSN